MNDKRYDSILNGAAVAGILLFMVFLATLVLQSIPAIQANGLGFVTGKEWNPVTVKLGALPFIAGTLLTSLLALALSLPFSLAIGIVLGEYASESRISAVANTIVNLLATIPSVVYGLWGLAVVVPLVRNIETALGVPPYGVGIASASLVLAIMIIPYLSSITREVLLNVPSSVKQGALALGSTRSEMITGIALPYVRSGILAGVLLSLGRALGETMAVTMLIGNATRMPTSIFSIGNTLASIIASQFNEAESDVHRSGMIGLALILFMITFIINYFGRRVIQRTGVQHGI